MTYANNATGPFYHGTRAGITVTVDYGDSALNPVPPYDPANKDYGDSAPNS